jgi:hypothetical protein
MQTGASDAVAAGSRFDISHAEDTLYRERYWNDAYLGALAEKGQQSTVDFLQRHCSDRKVCSGAHGRLFIEPIEMLYAWAAKNDDALSKLRRRRKKHTASRDKARKVQ